jgi:hypothetical protein
MSYATPDAAAPNINVLMNYLESLEDFSSGYIYRGQVREWDGPLIPSLYRRSIKLQRVFTDESAEYQYSLRKCGKSFVEMKPDSYLEKLLLRAREKGYDVTLDEYQAIGRLALDFEFSKLIATLGYETALAKKIRPEQMSYVLNRQWLWQSFIDEMHRGSIRHDGFVQPFGYMLGMTLAQHYGFSSELLDFTSDIRVAAFFATHDGPRFLFEGASISQRTGTKIGVIYRLPSTKGNVKYERIDGYDYYTCPPQIHMSDLCERFEDKSSPEMKDQWLDRLSHEEIAALANGAIILPYFAAQLTEIEMKERRFTILESIDKYLDLYYTCGGIRYYRLLDLAKGAFEHSRLGRQNAVIIVPDELRQTIHPNEGQDYAIFQAIEDLSKRRGFERFYFKHSDIQPDIGKIDREYLWPRENDVFKLIVSRVLALSTPVYTIRGRPIQKRIDLISSGFSR